jgi:hypothetical protein
MTDLITNFSLKFSLTLSKFVVENNYRATGELSRSGEL